MQQAQNIFQRILIILPAELFGLAVIHSLTVDGEYRRDPGVRVAADGFHLLQHASRHHHYRHVLRFGPSAHAADHLSPDALAVKASLAGDHEVAVLQPCVKIHQIQDCFYAGAKRPAQKRENPRAECAGSAGAGNVRHGSMQFPPDRLVQSLQLMIQKFHHSRICALLGAEDAGRAGRAVHGVVNIAHRGNMHAAQQFLSAADVNVFDPLQRAAHRDEGAPLPIQKADAQSRRAAAAAVVGAASAQSQQDLPVPLLHRVANLLAHAVGAGSTGILAAAYQRQSGAGRHFNDGPAAVQLQIGGFHILSVRPLNRDADFPPAANLMEAGRRSLAAIRYGDGRQLARRKNLSKALLCNLTDLLTAQRAFEGV